MRREDMYIVFAVSISGLCACAGSNQPVPPPGMQHLVELVRPDSRLYIDEVPSDMILQPDNEPGGNSAFYAYRVGMEDHRRKETPQETARQKYFNYDMEQDWKLVLNGDSVGPVFFHPLVRLDKAVREGVMVFEVPTGSTPQALVYDDATGEWGRQLMILNISKKIR